MLADGVFSLFPGAGFESSLLTAVLVGLLVTWLLNETMGWSFTGLVAPGYLASIFMVRPSAGVVVIIEALITYALVYFLGRFLASRVHFGPLFGKERFFAMLLASVGVRAVVEGWLLGWVSHLSVTWGVPLDDGSGLYAVGLVIIPLLANAVWSPGLVRGGLQLAVNTLITFLVLSLVLIPCTNLVIGDFELSFEDVAAGFAASPNAYLVLLTSAFVATLVGRRLHWDLGGTLVPGLLAVACLTPKKAMATVLEVVLALLIAAPWRKLGVFRTASSRRLIVAFGLLYFVRLGIALVADNSHLGMHVSDLWGFGYILPALIVERIWTAGKPLMVLGPIVVLSISGVFLGSLSGLVLERFIPNQYDRRPPPITSKLATTIDRELVAAPYRVNSFGPTPASPALRPQEIVRFRAVIQSVMQGDATLAAHLGAKIGLELAEFDEGWAIRESLLAAQQPRGFGTIILFCNPQRTGPVIEVPFPQKEPAASAAVWVLANSIQSRAILLGGYSQRALRSHQKAWAISPFTMAKKTLSPFSAVIRLRQGKTLHQTGQALKAEIQSAILSLPGLGSTDWLPDTSTANNPETPTLFLPTETLKRMASHNTPLPKTITESALEKKLAQTFGNSSGSVLTATQYGAQLLPLILKHGRDPLDLRYFHFRSQALGFDVALTEQSRSLLLASKQRPLAFLIDLDRREQTGPIIQAPRAGTEIGTYQIGLDLFYQLDGTILCLAGAQTHDFFSKVDGLIRQDGAIFSLSPKTLVVRGMPLSSQVPDDVLAAPIATRMGLPSPPEHMKPWLKWLSQSGLRYALADNRPEHAFAFSSNWHQHLRNRENVTVLWFNWSLRDSLRCGRDLDFEWLAQLIPVWHGSPMDWAKKLSPKPVLQPEVNVQYLANWATKLVHQHHPGLARQLEREVQKRRGELAFWDRGEQAPYLLIGLRSNSKRVVSIISLAPRLGARLWRGAPGEIPEFIKRHDLRFTLVME